MYRFRILDIVGVREVVHFSAGDDEDAVKLGRLYFESDVGIRSLEVTLGANQLLAVFVKAEGSD